MGCCGSTEQPRGHTTGYASYNNSSGGNYK